LSHFDFHIIEDELKNILSDEANKEFNEWLVSKKDVREFVGLPSDPIVNQLIHNG
jgi:hypothetical protein